ncbi:MAG: hypothetical protein DRP86_02155 [Candidatus Neomarinimicrobiota bacterium]|nr:hypothetical protein [Candidatus Neomarinimicrobiota bacterium]RKY51183.1 MAG: hypothetical protein DRP86_02155 [Candidatus Neomarinimicrobiota bacterium]
MCFIKRLRVEFLSCLIFWLMMAPVLTASDPDDSISCKWVLKQRNRNDYLTITIHDTLVDSLDCLRYREIFTASPLGGVDVIFNRKTGEPVWFRIPALGEEVKVDYSKNEYLVNKRMKDKSYTMHTPFERVAFPSYARFARLLYHSPPTDNPIEFYLYNGKTVPYLYEAAGMDTLNFQNRKIPCRKWHVSMKASPLMGQEDYVWIKDNPPVEIMKVKFITRIGKVLGFSLGKNTAVFERVY